MSAAARAPRRSSGRSGAALKVWGETCTQYLVLTADDLDRPGLEGAKFVCSPAPRSRADQAALWEMIRRGVIGNVTSDHAPTRFGGPDGKSVFGSMRPSPNCRTACRGWRRGCRSCSARAW